MIEKCTACRYYDLPDMFVPCKEHAARTLGEHLAAVGARPLAEERDYEAARHGPLPPLPADAQGNDFEAAIGTCPHGTTRNLCLRCVKAPQYDIALPLPEAWRERIEDLVNRAAAMADDYGVGSAVYMEARAAVRAALAKVWRGEDPTK